VCARATSTTPHHTTPHHTTPHHTTPHHTTPHHTTPHHTTPHHTTPHHTTPHHTTPHHTTPHHTTPHHTTPHHTTPHHASPPHTQHNTPCVSCARWPHDVCLCHATRPIAMSVPDNDLIAEVLLASEGFTCAKALAAKLVSLYSLAQEGLTRQQHYDWGLRALKTALGAAGRLLRQVRRRRMSRAACRHATDVCGHAVSLLAAHCPFIGERHTHRHARLGQRTPPAPKMAQARRRRSWCARCARPSCRRSRLRMLVGSGA
jgi:hypothetical protein